MSDVKQEQKKTAERKKGIGCNSKRKRNEMIKPMNLMASTTISWVNGRSNKMLNFRAWANSALQLGKYTVHLYYRLVMNGYIFLRICVCALVCNAQASKDAPYSIFTNEPFLVWVASFRGLKSSVFFTVVIFSFLFHVTKHCTHSSNYHTQMQKL